MSKSTLNLKSSACSHCYLCSAPGQLLHKDIKDKIFGTPGNWNIKKCTNADCKLIWLDPRPEEKELSKAYINYYTHANNDFSKGGMTKLLRIIYYLTTFISDSILGTQLEKSSLEYMFLNKTRQGKLLEIGCGSGNFLYKMKNLGWEVEGIDFDLEAVQAANQTFGINAKAKTLKEMDYPNNLFDAITLNHVIEHVSDPIFIFQECYRILKQGGSLIIITPNPESWGHEKFGCYWRGLEPPRHLHLFSANNLYKCAERSGFENIKTWTSTARSLGILGGSLDIREAQDSINIKPKKINLIKAWVLSIYEGCYSKFNKNIGEEAILIAQK